MSLNHMDMKDMIVPILGIDQYKSKIAGDDQIITIDFTVNDKNVASDLVDWIERGYDFIIDADVSPGEITSKKFAVFVEINRRLKAPKQIIELIEDLETLCGLKLDAWNIKINDKTIEATEENIKDNLTLSPLEYREKLESELNEWRQIAGINTVNLYEEQDSDILEIQRIAGIK